MINKYVDFIGQWREDSNVNVDEINSKCHFRIFLFTKHELHKN